MIGKRSRSLNTFTNEKGFTLIEVIAVLAILGVLIAVAAPRYIEVIQQSKIAIAKSQVAEMKSALNLAYAKLFISNRAAPSLAADVIFVAAGTTEMPITIGAAPDVWTVSMTGAAAVATITVQQRGTDTQYSATGTWNIPQ